MTNFEKWVASLTPELVAALFNVTCAYGVCDTLCPVTVCAPALSECREVMLVWLLAEEVAE